MFFLTLLEHQLHIPPHLLHLPPLDAVKGELEKLFLDKVVAELGLCISIYDIKNVSDASVVAGDGHLTCTVKFRMVMFQPSVGEIIIGRIESYDRNGLQVSLGFFTDVFIPKHQLQQPADWSPESGWRWISDGESFPLDIGSKVRFRVSSVKFPPIPIEQKDDDKPYAPMEIVGDISGDGLGLCCWW